MVVARGVGLLVAASGFCPAGIATIDWESDGLCAASWTFHGLRVANSRGTICVNSSPHVSNGTVSCNDVAGMVIDHINGKTFTPTAIDLGEYHSASNTEQVIHFVGHKPDGATVNASFDLDLIADGPGGMDDFQNFTFPPDFANTAEFAFVFPG